MIIKIVVLTTTISLLNADQSLTDDAEMIDNLFKTGNSHKAMPDHEKKLCNDGYGECIPAFRCKNGQSDSNEEGKIDMDIRFDVNNECVDYLEVCCDPIDILPPIRQPETDSYICGKRNSEGIVFKITGNNNHESEYGEFPWMVAILKQYSPYDFENYVYKCGGSLLGPNVVLTAAHCVTKTTASELKIRAGEWDTQTKNEVFSEVEKFVEEIVIHENFSLRNLQNDVALLFLKDNFEFALHIGPVCLPEQDQLHDSRYCFVTGWGKNVFGKEGEYQAILKKLELPTVPFDKCERNLRKTRLGQKFKLHNSFMCAGGEEGVDACEGDGGSPLVCPVDGSTDQYYQAGIVAWGIGCGTKDVPGVYVDVAKFSSWINQKIAFFNSRNNNIDEKDEEEGENNYQLDIRLN